MSDQIPISIAFLSFIDFFGSILNQIQLFKCNSKDFYKINRLFETCNSEY